MEPQHQPVPVYTSSPVPHVAIHQPDGAVLVEKQPYGGQQEQQQQQQQPQPQPMPMMAPGINGPPMPRNQYQNATPIQSLQEFPAVIDCPSCGGREMTAVTPETGNTTNAWAALLCICCCLGCIPYLMSSLKDALHRCGHCGVPVALWHRSGRVEVLAHR